MRYISSVIGEITELQGIEFLGIRDHTKEEGNALFE